MEKNYSDLSKSLTNELSSSVKKKQGIFFTPKESIVTFSNFLKNVLKHQFKTVLEPSCGSCEFIKYFDATNEDIQITGIEYNTKIYESIQGLSFQNNVQILHKDFLTYETDKKFDLILGNPPYFVMKKSDLPNKYHHCIIGRPNIFLAFILKSLELLNENGILAFVLPKSFLNCSYYKKLREEIYNHYSVKKIIDCSDHQYLETQQETILLILKKTSKKINNERYVLNNDFYLFNTKENIIRMKELIQGSTTLHQLGFHVFNGNFVWNQEREYLTNDLNYRRLIYSNDIVNNELCELNSNELEEKWNAMLLKLEEETDNQKRKKLIDKIEKKHCVNDSWEKHACEGPLLIINRGYGKGGYNFNYALVDLDDLFYLENHVLGIRYDGEISKEELKEKYTMIINSFQNQNTERFIEICMGNNAMNTTELEYLLPIF